MSDAYWDARIETLPRDERAMLQDHRLQWQIRRCLDGSPFYRERLGGAGIDASSFGGMKDLERLPLLTLDDLRHETEASLPFGRLAVAPRDWWEEANEDGPAPRRVWTDGDVSHRADLAARALWVAGVGRIGSYAARRETDGGAVSDPLVEAAIRAGLQRVASQSPGSSTGTEIAVRWTNQLSAPDDTDDAPYQAFGLPTVSPTLAYECRERNGLHWAEDHLLVEVVDPATGRAQAPGGPGLLVLTELTREGSPLIRFGTGLLTSLDETPCRCGRTSARSSVVQPIG